MRHWLLVFMLVLLPIQSSWAAVATYCEHETGAAAKHFGHHDRWVHGHDHDQDDTDTDAAAGEVYEAGDLDCSHCHGQCAGMVAEFEAFIAGSHTSRFGSAVDEQALLQALNPPERPQWALLA